MRHCILCMFAFVMGAFGLPHFAVAQAYPNKPVRVIVPFPAGGTADLFPRLVGPKMAERMGQQVIVDNRPGASGQVGLQQIKTATPDGYTIALGLGGPLSIAPHTYKTLPYDPLKDFAPVALVATNYGAVITHPSAPFKTAAELIAWAKANPGKLSVANNGEGGFPHLAFEYLAKMGGFKFTPVPYKGDPQVLTDVLGGQIAVGVGAYTSFYQHVESGRVRLIAVTNPVRVPNKPELPIFADAVPGYDMRGWFGFIAPAGTPRDVVARLNEEINRAIKAPDVSEKLIASGMIIATGSPEFFGELMKAEYAKFGKLVRDIGFQPQ
jgi:tripartite-type tricarboxylate transporter receptor subunit TctC